MRSLLAAVLAVMLAVPVFMAEGHVRHKFVSTIPDGPDVGQVKPSNWNDDHEVIGELSLAQGPVVSPDLFIVRDAANTLALRNGASAQTFLIYNTFTDASNYERGFLKWNSNQLFLGTEAAGSGSIRDLALQSAAGIFFKTGGSTDRWVIAFGGTFFAATDNTYDIGSVGANRPRNLHMGSFIEGQEESEPAAPATNRYRLYSKDNGSGVSQLCARFATGASQCFAADSGDLLLADNLIAGAATGGTNQLGAIFPGSVTQASLSGSATNGQVVYCSDCTIANPCAAAGTGALAKRLNGVWVCN